MFSVLGMEIQQSCTDTWSCMFYYTNGHVHGSGSLCTRFGSVST